MTLIPPTASLLPWTNLIQQSTSNHWDFINKKIVNTFPYGHDIAKCLSHFLALALLIKSQCSAKCHSWDITGHNSGMRWMFKSLLLVSGLQDLSRHQSLEIYQILLDLRPCSPTQLQDISVLILVPPGFSFWFVVVSVITWIIVCRTFLLLTAWFATCSLFFQPGQQSPKHSRQFISAVLIISALICGCHNLSSFVHFQANIISAIWTAWKFFLLKVFSTMFSSYFALLATPNKVAPSFSSMSSTGGSSSDSVWTISASW